MVALASCLPQEKYSASNISNQYFSKYKMRGDAWSKDGHILPFPACFESFFQAYTFIHLLILGACSSFIPDALICSTVINVIRFLFDCSAINA